MHCAHCSAPIVREVKATIGEEERVFCCEGCKHVAEFIHDESLDAFYTSKTGVLPLSFTEQYPLAYYDSESFSKEYITHNTLEVVSTSIHCAACVFLIEKILNQLPEVTHARVNLTESRIRIELTGEGQISNIFTALAQVGYSARTIDTDAQEQAARAQKSLMLRRIGFAFFAMMNMMWIAISLYTGAEGGEFNQYFVILSFLLATPTLFYSGWGFLSASVTAVRYGVLTMDVPIAIGSIATYLYSSVVMFGLVEGGIYFDTVVNFIFIILLGRYLEASSKQRIITDNNSIKSLDTKVMTRIRGTTEEVIPTKTAEIGDIFRVKPGEVIPTDATITQGFVSVDESLLSGESLPIERTHLDEVYGGTLVTSGSAVMRVRNTYLESSYAKLIELLSQADIAKGRIFCLIDSIIPYFVIATLTLSALSFIFHIASGGGFDFALMAAVSVLIITCPCAFGIAVPMTYYAANNALFRNKVIIKDSNILEHIQGLQTIVFDKTGTLTTGVFTVMHAQYHADELTCQQIAITLAHSSEHPLSQSIADYLKVAPLASSEFTNYPGFGISVVIDDVRYFMGSKVFIQMHTNNTPKALSSAHSAVYLASKNSLLASFGLADKLNTEASELITYLQEKGNHVVLLSGDRAERVAVVAEQLGISEYYAEQTPVDKLAFIQSQSGVLMIGDGLNDAPALKAADYSIAVRGLELVETAVSAIIMKNNLSAIISLYEVAGRAQRTIKTNISFALGYNMIFVPLAFLGLLNPIIAAIVMPISSLVVIGNALRLQLVSKRLIK